jgi:lysophospholipase L1-like esterase
MRVRSSFRPIAWDVLEERVVLSKLVHALGPASALPHRTATATAAAAVTIGALGDSYTDEYRFYPPDRSQARNWVEILAATRRVSFGAFGTASRGEPRNQGFAFNWARSDATSSNMIANQVPGLAAQVAQGQVGYVSIFIGGNDFLFFLRDVQNGTLPSGQALSVLAQVEAQAAANFTTAVKALLAASPTVRLVVFTVPDVSELPVVQILATTPTEQAVVAAAGQAIGEYNATIQAVAAGDSRIALIDLAGQSAELAQLAGGSVPFGNTTINLTTPGDDYHHFFLADGIHVGTVGQGLIANDVVTAIDTSFQGKIAPLTPQQIVNFAKQAQSRSKHGDGLP